jgi:asparagine synthase (glutamine-hydrolysing)
LPEHLFERPKHGFNVPVGPWLKSSLRDWAESLWPRHDFEIRGFWTPRAFVPVGQSM